MTTSKIRPGNFDIDEYLVYLSPPPWLYRLPRFVSHFLGYREHEPSEPPDVLVWLWTWIGVFCGVATLEAVFGSSFFMAHGVPAIVGGFVNLEEKVAFNVCRVRRQFLSMALSILLLLNHETFSSATQSRR